MNKKILGSRFFLALVFLSLISISVVKAQPCGVDPSFTIEQHCDSVVFQNTSIINSGVIDSIQWYFGTGDTLRVLSLFSDPVYFVYPFEGSYAVNMKVFNSAPCDTSVMATVNVFRPNADFSVVTACLNDSTFFTDLSISNADSLIAWQWDFGDLSSSSIPSPSHIYISSNSYDIQLTVTNNYVCVDSITKTRVIESPNPGFIFDSVCFGSATQFTDTSTFIQNGINQWFWDFGDGTTSILKNPTHTFLTPGIHSVSLMVTNTKDCSSTVIQDVLVGSIPQADFILDLACPKDTVHFTDKSLSNADSLISWDWNFGDGTPHAFVPDTAHVFSAGGIYDISLTVMNNFNCSDDSTLTITFDKPVAEFLFDSVCYGWPTTFTDLSSFNPAAPITSWNWDFSDGGTSQAQDTTYAFAAPALYPVELIVGNETGCTDTVVHDVPVNDLPIAIFSYDAACASLQTCFTDLSIPNADTTASWIWFFGDGSSSILQNPCHTYSDTGTYVVLLIVTNTNGCTSLPHQDTLYVSYRPDPNFEFTEGCFGDTTYFTNLTDSLGYDLNYLWSFGDPGSGVNNNSTLVDPQHYYDQQKSYLVKLKAENVWGCSDSLVKVVAIDSIPEANFIAPDTIGRGVEIVITDLSKPHGSPILTKEWDFGDGTVQININPVIHTYDSAGWYSICLTVEDFNGCSDTWCDSIYVIGLPTADFVYASDVTFETFFYDSSTPDATIVDWFWDFGDLISTSDTISHVAQPTYIYPAEGWYNAYLRVTDKFGGIRDTNKLVYAGNAVVAGFDDYGYCLGDSTTFIDSSFSPISAGFENWYWDFGDDSVLTSNELLDTVVHFYTGPGTYHVKYAISATVNGFFMSDTMFRDVSIFESPIAKIDTNNLGVCFGKNIYFVDNTNAPVDPIAQWLWDFDTPQGDSAYIQNPSHKYIVVGDYEVKMKVMSEHGCSDIDTVTAHVTTSPDFDFEVLHPCINSQTTFVPQYSTSEWKITEWSWNFGDVADSLNTSTDSIPIHIYEHIANYTITMNMSAYGCPGSYEETILVYPIPYSEFTITPDFGDIQGRTQFTNNSIYADSYLWDFGNGHTSTVENPVEFYEQDSLYSVTLVSTSKYSNNRSCSDTSRHEILIFFKGLYFPNAFSPGNPNDEVSRFVPKGVNLDKYLVQVFDMRGNLLWESDKLDEYGTPAESWDGYYNGLLMSQGTYVWKASGIFKDGSSWKGQSFDSSPPKTNGIVTIVN